MIRMTKSILVAAALLAAVSSAEAASITVTPDPINFGDVTVGTTDTVAVTATFNPDPGYDMAYWVGFISGSGAPFSYPGGRVCFLLTCTFDISFSPTTSGSFVDTIVLGAFDFDDTDFAPAGRRWTESIDLSGTGVAAPSAIPEPATLPLFATGLGGLGLLGWRRKQKARVSLLGAA